MEQSSVKTSLLWLDHNYELVLTRLKPTAGGPDPPK